VTDGRDADDHAVELVWRDERSETVNARADEPVLAAAERAGVSLPFGCRTGACATCTGRLRSGRVEHARPPRALKDRHLEAGYVLLCVAEPRADSLIDVGSGVADELVSNPWK